jgi:hypothetical protein
MKLTKYVSVGLSVCSLLAISACSEDNSKDSMNQSYELTVSNLTGNQPFSPLAAIIHDDQYSAWSIGEASSVGLEQLAESGGVNLLLSDAVDLDVLNTETGSGLILPGESETLEIESIPAANLQLTLAGMLVNTNDAFVGTSGLALHDLQIGDSLTVLLPVYDAGTEMNTELSGTIPGPADGGEGFNILRDDVNVVSRHSGVVTNEDGNTDSILDSSYRFDAPAAKLVLKRTM